MPSPPTHPGGPPTSPASTRSARWAGAEKAAIAHAALGTDRARTGHRRCPRAPPRTCWPSCIASDAALRPLTVVTNGLRIADVLHGARRASQVILTGGVRTPSDALVGPVADATLASLRVDRTYLGVHGLDAAA